MAKNLISAMKNQHPPLVAQSVAAGSNAPGVELLYCQQVEPLAKRARQAYLTRLRARRPLLHAMMLRLHPWLPAHQPPPPVIVLT